MIDKKFINQRNAFVRQILRRGSLRWKARNEAKSKARVSRGFYMCAECGPDKLYGPKEIHLDHIDPVVPVDSHEQSWDSYIERLLPNSDGFQVLCIFHHNSKTQNEDFLRAVFKKKRKKKN